MIYNLINYSLEQKLYDYSLKQIDPMFLKIASNFFAHYKDLNGKEVKVLDWHEKHIAHQIINESIIK